METFVKHFIYGKVNKFATGGKLKATFKWVVDGEEKGHVLTLKLLEVGFSVCIQHDYGQTTVSDRLEI